MKSALNFVILCITAYGYLVLNGCVKLKQYPHLQLKKQHKFQYLLFTTTPSLPSKIVFTLEYMARQHRNQGTPMDLSQTALSVIFFFYLWHYFFYSQLQLFLFYKNIIFDLPQFSVSTPLKLTKLIHYQLAKEMPQMKSLLYTLWLCETETILSSIISKI